MPSETSSSLPPRRFDVSPELEEKNVLVVEDYPQNRDLIVRFLEFAGIQADSASTGTDALAKVKAENYDLILMDIQLPIMDGCEVTRQIRAWEIAEGRKKVPIVAISANSREVDRRRAREAGCTMFIAKPVSPRGLLDTLGTVVASAPT